MGSGFKDFAAGDILTAADVDGYLMRQTVMTFADAAARDAALSGVLDEGMVAYLEATDRTTYYDGSAWQDIAKSSSIGTWTAFTPTWQFGANAITASSNVGEYTIVNNLVIIRMYLSYSSKAGGGDMQVTVPAGAAIGALASSYRLGYGSMFDISLVSAYSVSPFNDGASSTIFKFLDNTEGFIVSDTAPFTWAAGDEMHVTLIGQKA